MAILKKPARKCNSPRTATSLEMLSGAARTLAAPTEKEILQRMEMNRIQLATMKVDLRLHEAQAELAEIHTARARLDLAECTEARAKKSAR